MDGALKILSFVGFWKPTEWSDAGDSRGRLYDLARWLVVPLPFLVVLGQLMYVLVVAETLDSMMVALYFLPTTFSASLKGLNVMLWRRDIVQLREQLNSRLAVPASHEEEDIARNYRNAIDSMYSAYFWVIEAIVFLGTLNPLLGHNTLPLEMWLPYDHTSSIAVYSASFVMNLIGGVCLAQLAIGIDVTLIGFLLNIICQLELLTHRLVNLTKVASVKGEETLLRQCVKHHAFIYRFADKFVSTFRVSILSQWIASSTVVSISVYSITHDLSNMNVFNFDFGLKINNIIGVMMELFLMCWFSEQITLKSQELGATILDSDWTALDLRSIKTFLLVSLRTTRPIVISSGYFFTFSLETFKAILKASYSAMNILRNSSN